MVVSQAQRGRHVKDARFTGTVVLVTGASAGVGEAAAMAFAAEGASVVLAARGVSELERVARAIRAAGGTAEVVPCDVADIEAARRLMAHVIERFGALDVLVNNAGANRRGEIARYEPEELAQVVQVNLIAPIVLTRLALPHLERARGGGAIVNVASLAGRVPLVHEAVYSATKFGLRAFTYAFAEEVRGAKVKVSVVSPGPIATGFILDDPDQVPDLVFSQPMSTAEEIAALVLDCAHDGVIERTRPRLGAKLATLGYLLPPLRRAMQPLLEARGLAAKKKYRRDAKRS